MLGKRQKGVSCHVERRAGAEQKFRGSSPQLHPWVPPCCLWQVRKRTDTRASSRRSLKMQEERLKGSLVEVAPEKPPKRAGCCSWGLCK